MYFKERGKTKEIFENHLTGGWPAFLCWYISNFVPKATPHEHLKVKIFIKYLTLRSKKSEKSNKYGFLCVLKIMQRNMACIIGQC